MLDPFPGAKRVGRKKKKRKEKGEEGKKKKRKRKERWRYLLPYSGGN